MFLINMLWLILLFGHAWYWPMCSSITLPLEIALGPSPADQAQVNACDVDRFE